MDVSEKENGFKRKRKLRLESKKKNATSVAGWFSEKKENWCCGLFIWYEKEKCNCYCGLVDVKIAFQRQVRKRKRPSSINSENMVIKLLGQLSLMVTIGST